MTRKEIEDRMRLPIHILCLAILSKQPEEVERATFFVFDAVENIAVDIQARYIKGILASLDGRLAGLDEIDAKGGDAN